MKKFLSFNMIFVLLCLCACNDNAENRDTRFLFDTVVNLEVSCDDEILEEAFELCTKYEKMFSRTVEDSEISRINKAQPGEETKVSNETAELIERTLYYSYISGGAFDITVGSVSRLWNFNGEVIPERKEIAEALQSVDYHNIVVADCYVDTGNSQIDLGAVAKGFIADRLHDFFISNDVEEGIINLGGNVVVFGDEPKIVGIKKPYSDDELSARVKIANSSVVTAGVYERYIEKDGKKYHHILDPKTGYGVESDLLSATVIGDNSVECDALSTICILLGYENSYPIIEQFDGVEAVYITKDGKIKYTSGLKKEDDVFLIK